MCFAKSYMCMFGAEVECFLGGVQPLNLLAFKMKGQTCKANMTTLYIMLRHSRCFYRRMVLCHVPIRKEI